MTRDKPERKARKREMSARGRAMIEERAVKARPRQLAELQVIARSRGRITDQELTAVAVLLAHLHHHDAIPGMLAEWLVGAGELPARAAAWLASTAGRNCMAEAEAEHEGRLVGRRRSVGVKALLLAWSITDEEAERLGLVELVGNARRMQLRRRAEGIRTAEEVQAERRAAVAEPKPWEAAGISKPAYYKRLKREAAAAVRAATGEPREEPEPWLAAGLSRATYFRRMRTDRETERETRRDHIAVEENRTEGEIPQEPAQPGLPALAQPTYFSLGNMVAPSLPRSLTQEVPPASAFPTAEARRFRALALRLNLPWMGGDDPTMWFGNRPRALSAAEQEEVDAAVRATLASLTRRDAIERARAREADAADTRTPAQREADFHARLADRERQHRTANEQGERPARVSKHVWDEVPMELRTRVTGWAGRFFLTGIKPDDAVPLAVDAARREALIVDQVLAADPSANVKTIQQLIVTGLRNGWWQLATAEAVSLVLAKFAEDRAALDAAAMAASEVIERNHPSLPAGEREAVVEQAARLLVGFPGTSPTHAVNQARDAIRGAMEGDD